MNKTPNKERKRSWDAPVASLERVQRLHASSLEIARISRGNNEVVSERGGRNHSIQQRHRLAFLLQVYDEPGPTLADHGVPRKAIDGLHERVKASA